MRFKLTAVFVSAVSAYVIAYGQQRSAVWPDVVFFNGKVVTVDAHFTTQQAFAIKDDRFIAVGNNKSVRSLAGATTRFVDLNGHTVIPGLGDNHDHLYDSAKIILRGVSLQGVASVSEALERIREAARRAQPGQTVFTSVLRLPRAAGDALTIHQLDQVSTTVPIVVFRGRFGRAVLNTAALRLAGVTRETASFVGVPVPKDANGDLTGENPPAGLSIASVEAGQALLEKVLPRMTNEEEEDFLLRAIHERNVLGLTSIRDLNVSERGMAAYFRLWRKGVLTLRVSMGLLVKDAAHVEEAARAWGVGSGFGDTWLRFDSISEFPTPVLVNARQFTAAALAANRYGWRLSPHIEGSDTLKTALDAYEAADRDNSIHDKRWVLEHVPFATPDDLDRIAKLGVVVSAQYPGYDGPAPKDKASPIPLPMREFLNRRVVVSAGSDFLAGPNSSDNPFIPIYFYVTRRTRSGDVIGPEQKISREEALRISTINYAYTTFEEKVKGSIESGKLADFLVLSDDILSVPEEKILSLHPLATYVGGHKVFQTGVVSF